MKRVNYYTKEVARQLLKEGDLMTLNRLNKSLRRNRCDGRSILMSLYDDRIWKIASMLDKLTGNRHNGYRCYIYPQSLLND